MYMGSIARVEMTEMTESTVPTIPMIRPTMLMVSVLPCFLALSAQMMAGIPVKNPQQTRLMIAHTRDATARLCAG